MPFQKVRRQCYSSYMYKKRPTANINVGAKGQIVIPAALRTELGICDGDLLFATLNEEGWIVMTKISRDPIERLREAAGDAFKGIDPTAFIRALRDEWDD